MFHLTFADIHISAIFKDGTRQSLLFHILKNTQPRATKLMSKYIFFYATISDVLILTFVDIQISAILKDGARQSVLSAYLKNYIT